MRKITSFGLTAAALGALGWVATAQAQPAPEGTPAPATAPAAPAPAPAPAPEAAPAPAPAPDNSAPAAAPAPDASAPADNSGAAPAPAKTKMHHKMMHGSKGKSMSMHRGGDAGNAAVDDLNAKSLSAAKSGSNYTPSKADESAPAPKDEGKGMKPMHHAHHHHMMMKKKAAASDSSTPAPDATPAPSGSDTSGSDNSGK